VIDRLLDEVAASGWWVVLLGAFGFAFAETALFLDLVVPGEVGLVVAGAAGERADVALPLIVGAAAAGAICGDSVSYALGRRYGLRLIRRWEPVRRRLEPSVERARGHFADRGGRAVFFGRFVGALRAVVPFVAGMSAMPLRRFLAWNVAASVVWTSIVVSLGFFVGRHVHDDVDRVSLLFSAVVIGGLVVSWFVRRRRARRVNAPS
jgi:membrane-associated protein